MDIRTPTDRDIWAANRARIFRSRGFHPSMNCGESGFHTSGSSCPLNRVTVLVQVSLSTTQGMIW